MEIFDIIILFLALIGFIRGIMKGMLRQLATFLGLIVGLWAARALYVSLAERIVLYVNESLQVAQVLAFLAIWIIVPLLFVLVAAFFAKVLELVSLGWLNRLAGGILGVAKYLLIASLLICVVEFVDTDSKLVSKTQKENSLFYYPLSKAVATVFPVAKKITEKYI